MHSVEDFYLNVKKKIILEVLEFVLHVLTNLQMAIHEMAVLTVL